MGERHGVNRLLLAGVLGLVGLVLVLLGAAGPASGHVAAQDGATTTAATKPISVKPGSLNDHECNDTEWHFVITQIDKQSDAPATIHVTWANGQQADVPLDKFTGKTAHYSTTANLDSTVVSATATIYSGWSGQFNLSHGPCGTPSTSSAPPTSASVPPSSSSVPPSSSSAPETTSSAPETTSSSSSAASSPAVVPSTSPFVPGPGQTGDNPPPGGFPLRPIMLGSGIGLLGFAAALSSSVLRRRGSHT